MGETVKRIVINTESIDVISVSNGVNNVEQLSLEPQGKEKEDILAKYNLSQITNYPFDMKIVRALSNNEEQLRDYLEVCKNAHNTKQKIKVPENMPQITYDFKDLKHSFEEIDDEILRKAKQIEMYKTAKETQNTFKGAKGKTELKMGVMDKAYFAVQELLQNRNKKQVQALSAGNPELRRNIREELRDETLTEKTNAVAKEYAFSSQNRQTEKEER